MHWPLIPGNPIVVAIPLAALVFLDTVCFSEGVKMFSTGGSHASLHCIGAGFCGSLRGLL